MGTDERVRVRIFMSALNGFIDRLLGKWIDFAVRRHVMIIVVAFLATVFALWYTANNLGFNTDTRDMLSSRLDWRQIDLAYEKAFPMYVEDILIVVEADTPDQASDTAQLLYQRLINNGELFDEIFFPAGMEFLQQTSFMYLDTDELHELADRLASIQPFLGQLVRDQSLRGLFGLLEDAIDARRAGEYVDIEPLLNQIIEILQSHRNSDIPRYLSWQNLIAGETEERDVYREYIFINPVIDYASLLPGDSAVKAARADIQALTEQSDLGTVNIRLTGGSTLAYEELESVSRGAGLAALLALFVVTIILTVGLRSWRMIAAALFTLIVGLILTAAMAAATVGELNLISVAFAVLYIGLGIDFAIHFCLRFRELRRTQGIPVALHKTGVTIGRSLALCAITTAIGLYAFIPTQYRGIAELGWISGTGMFISLIVTMTLLPAILTFWPPHNFNNQNGRTLRPLEWFATVPVNHARTITLGALGLVVIALLLLPSVRFDPNTLNLQDPTVESVQTFRDLLADSDDSPWSGIVLVKGKDTLAEKELHLEQLELVDSVRTIRDFIPDDQEEKLYIIDEMNFLLSGTLAAEDETAITGSKRREALDSLIDHLMLAPPQSGEPELQALLHELMAYREFLESAPDKAAARLKQLEIGLLHNLPGRLRSLIAALNAQPVMLENIPDNLLRRWVSQDGWYRIEILPRDDLNEEKAKRAFVDQVRTVAPTLIGMAVIQLEAGDAVVDAFIHAFALALTVITLLLLVLLRSVRDTVLALAPLLLAALLTAATTVILDMPFNFANIIALPLLLGIGVDNSIHMLYRYHHALPDHGLLLRTSTARAILVSALTTICSIGNLAFSAHVGTASMGLLLAIGITISLACALVLLPSLLALRQR
jgi:uncharacterized protein